MSHHLTDPSIDRGHRICLIGDSFGTQRIHDGDVEVAADCTWPQQIQRALPGMDVVCDFKPFRRLVECAELLSERTDCELAIVQAGLVDCYPRPLPHGVSRSSHLACRVLRRCIRPVRRAWINYVYRTTWSSREELVLSIEALLTQSPTRQTGLVTAAPLLKEHAIYTPGAQEAVFEFNDLLREIVARCPRAFLIDLHAHVLAAGHRVLLSPWDSHLNQPGNDALAGLMLGEIRARVPTSAAAFPATRAAA
ncbi:MAG: hypothetical protein SH850_07425 [Planctomycetaceae bacterium]|nr:hypothetical protein [Planctomycetaceae bacterium]